MWPASIEASVQKRARGLARSKTWREANAPMGCYGLLVPDGGGD